MTQQERDSLAQEARVFYMIAPLVVPILEKRKSDCIMRLRSSHQQGNSNHTALVAELSAYANIEDEIKRKSQEYDSILEEKNGK